MKKRNKYYLAFLTLASLFKLLIVTKLLKWKVITFDYWLKKAFRYHAQMTGYAHRAAAPLPPTPRFQPGGVVNESQSEQIIINPGKYIEIKKETLRKP